MVCFYGLILTLKTVGGRDAADGLIPVYVLLTALYSVSLTCRDGRLLTAALFCAFIGDACINWIHWKPGALIFCLAHLLLIAFYLNIQPIRRQDLLVLLPFVAVGGAYYLAVKDDVPSQALAWLLIAYLILLSMMAWRALCTNNSTVFPLLAIGSLLFYLTDLSVLSDILYEERLFSLLTWTLYPPALFLLSLAGKGRRRFSPGATLT